MKFPLRIIFIFTLITLLPAACSNAPDHIRFVDPFIGVDDNGNTLPGPSLPFSFMRLGPDTPVPHPTSGYESGKPVKGFSHTHVSGTGGNSQYGNISVMPVSGSFDVYEWESPVSQEKTSAGYYSATLDRYGIKAELTQSFRSGIHRYTFPEGGDNYLTVDVGSMIKKNGGYLRNNITHADVKENRIIEGYTECQGSWGHGHPYRVYFYAEIKEPAEKVSVWNDGMVSPEDRTELRGKDGGIILKMAADGSNQVLLRIGISPLDIGSAKNNLDSEIPHWDFDLTRREAEKIWSGYLGRVDVEGGTDEQKTIFYTALYHAFVMPSDITGQNPKWESGEPAFWDYYTIWDTYRTVNPLYSLIAPEDERRIIRSLLDIYNNKGWLPDAWITGHYAMKQGGNNAYNIITDAIVKDLGGFDYHHALMAMKDDAEKISPEPWVIGRQSEYQQLGYCSSDINCSVGYTLEMAYNDFCIAEAADLLGYPGIAAEYYRNALNCYKLYNPDTGFFWGRSKEGEWAEGFTPDYLLKHYQAGYFYEGTPYQYVFTVQQDIQGFIDRTGGAEEFLRFMDTCFDEGHYTQHNQPDIHVPYLYNYINRPDRTAERVRDIMKNGYHARRSGLPGSDDAGCMSAWYVFSAMGFFPVPGQDIYLIGSPLFDKITLTLENNKKFVVNVTGNSPDNIYISSASLNGKALDKTWFRHSDIVNGGTLELTMAPAPGDWAEQGEAPPSLSTSGKLKQYNIE